MYLVMSIWLIVLGILGASSLIIAKKPNAKELIDKLAPYQGWLGAASSIWGLWKVIDAVLHMSILSLWPVLWILWLAVGLVQACLGLLLGVGVLKTWVKNAEAQARMDQVIVKLAPFQGTLGLIAIGLGAFFFIYVNFLFRPF